MVIFYDAIQKALHINPRDYDDPLKELDLNIDYKHKGKDYQHLTVKQKSTAKAKELMLDGALNQLSLKTIERQLMTLQSFLKETHRDLNQSLRRLPSSQQINGPVFGFVSSNRATNQ
mmetsp:Transcript_27387/g.37924  ORF Transcript_27387/g.37924 Transcript_27387/m.37924 type:complete len:117 (+) Transcript_27387:179-529(+)